MNGSCAALAPHEPGIVWAGMTHSVFISHATADRAAAREVCDAIEATGVRCWMAPRDIPPGAVWSACISEAIAGSRLFLVLVSRHAIRSPEVARELERGAARRQILLPVRLDRADLEGASEYFLSNAQWCVASQGPIGEHCPEIVRAVLVALGRTTSASTLSDHRQPRRNRPAPAPIHPDNWSRRGRPTLSARLVQLFDDR